jgi:hypothetical protein
MERYPSSDDTTMRILDLRRPGSASATQMDPKRKGTFTSNLLAYVQTLPGALYFTGWQHAGENLGAVFGPTFGKPGTPDPDVCCPVAEHELGL